MQDTSYFSTFEGTCSTLHFSINIIKRSWEYRKHNNRMQLILFVGFILKPTESICSCAHSLHWWVSVYVRTTAHRALAPGRCDKRSTRHWHRRSPGFGNGLLLQTLTRHWHHRSPGFGTELASGRRKDTDARCEQPSEMKPAPGARTHRFCGVLRPRVQASQKLETANVGKFAHHRQVSHGTSEMVICFAVACNGPCAFANVRQVPLPHVKFEYETPSDIWVQSQRTSWTEQMYEQLGVISHRGVWQRREIFWLEAIRHWDIISTFSSTCLIKYVIKRIKWED